MNNDQREIRSKLRILDHADRLDEADKSHNAHQYRADYSSFPLQLRSIPVLQWE